MQKLIGRLNKYLHPHVEYIEISKSHSPHCPALVAWDDDEYKRRIKLIQDVIAELLWLLRHHIKKFYSRRWGYKRTQSTLEKIKILKAELRGKLIFSGRLRDFIHKLP